MNDSAELKRFFSWMEMATECFDFVAGLVCGMLLLAIVSRVLRKTPTAELVAKKAKVQ